VKVTRLTLFTVALLGYQFATPCAFAKDKEKDKKDITPKMVDSGSFGVFSGAHRVATETFSIKQDAEGSVVSSEFKSEQGEQKADQSSQLSLTPSVSIRRYEWKELSPEKVEANVEPSDAFLVERYSVGATDKPQSQNFLLPASTSILDDYFFIHREVLAWKYLATACRQDKTGLGCPMKQKIQFGTLNPHARSSLLVSIEYTGKEKLTLRGSERELSHFVLRSETGDWAYWLDDQLKLVRLLSDNGIEVLRD
jgi:hypothetical protein